jgi:hypothetical protein
MPKLILFSFELKRERTEARSLCKRRRSLLFSTAARPLLNLGVFCDVNHLPNHIAADSAGVYSTKRIGTGKINTQFGGCFLFETVQGIADIFAV